MTYLFFYSICLLGQKQDSMHYALPQVLVTEDSLVNRVNIMGKPLPETALGSPISSTLSDLKAMGNVIRSYGPGQLSSISWHGMHGGSNGIYWNNVPLNDPLTGQIDASGISMFLLGDKVLFSGVNTEEGLPGGQLKFPPFTPLGPLARRAKLGFTTGQYGFREGYASAAYQSPVLAASIRTAALHNKNNFPYIENGQELILQHGERKFYGYSVQLNGVWNSRSLWDFSAHWMNDKKEIPPILYQRSNHANTGNQRWMTSMGWKHLRGNTFWGIRLSGVYSNTFYSDSLSAIDFKGNWKKGVLELSHGTTKGKWHWESRIRSDYTKARSTGFDGDKQVVSALWSGTVKRKFGSKSTGMTINSMLTSIQQKLITITGYFHTPIEERIVLHVVAGRYGRLPSFNDLYWIPGGNPELKPESSWGGDLIVDFLLLPSMKITCSLFDRHTRHYIQWLPAKGIFQAINIPAVWSRGGDIDLMYEMVRGWKLLSHYGYVRATYLKNRIPNDRAKGKQLIYIPFHQGNNTIKKVAKNWELILNHHWSGRRYTTSDNERYLPAYQTFDLHTAYTMHRKEMSIKLIFSVNNITDTYYQEVEGWLLPGRNIRAGANILFDTPKKSNKLNSFNHP